MAFVCPSGWGMFSRKKKTKRIVCDCSYISPSVARSVKAPTPRTIRPSRHALQRVSPDVNRCVLSVQRTFVPGSRIVLNRIEKRRGPLMRIGVIVSPHREQRITFGCLACGARKPLLIFGAQALVMDKARGIGL